MNAVSYPVARARRQAVIIVLAQVLATALTALLFGVLVGWQAARSALAGGGIGVLATAYMAFAVLRDRLPGALATQMMMRFVTGWAIKVMLTLGLLLVVFNSPALRPLPVLVAYVVVNIVYWGAVLKTSRSG